MSCYSNNKHLLKNFKVYVHITPNTKYYVGITCQEPKKRWKNGRGYVSNGHFINAINKYGWDNIEHFIVAENITLDEACNLELKLIECLKSNLFEFGYNRSIGGEGNVGISPSEETRKKISDSVKKLWEDENYKKNISTKLKNVFAGPVVLERHSQIRIGKYMGKDSGMSKLVRCKTTNEIFYGASEAGRKYKVQYKNILKVCHNERNYAGTYNGKKLEWEFIYDDRRS